MLFLIPLFLCWGSFLNCLAYRLVQGMSMGGRSQCPHCKQQIAWYDLIPVLSWVLLRGSCRSCTQRISPLYPSIELLTAILFTALCLIMPLPYIPAYALLFSGLIVTIRADLETMLIPRAATLCLIPFGLLASAFQLLPITLTQSLLGIAAGALFLGGISCIFSWLQKREGLGQGDIELIACVGAFTGPIGVWITLLVGSIGGTIVGIAYLGLTRQTRNTPIPFGPFLAAGALLYVLCSDWIQQIVLYGDLLS